MTSEQLECKLILLRKLKITAVKKTKSKKAVAPKTNKDKQLADMLSKLGPEETAALIERIKGNK